MSEDWGWFTFWLCSAVTFLFGGSGFWFDGAGFWFAVSAGAAVYMGLTAYRGPA